MPIPDVYIHYIVLEANICNIDTKEKTCSQQNRLVLHNEPPMHKTFISTELLKHKMATAQDKTYQDA